MALHIDASDALQMRTLCIPSRFSAPSRSVTIPRNNYGNTDLYAAVYYMCI